MSKQSRAPQERGFGPRPIPTTALTRYASPEAMAKALGTSRYPARGLTCADWMVLS